MLIGVFLVAGAVGLFFLWFFKPVIKRMIFMTFLLMGVGLVSAIVLKNFMVYKFQKSTLQYVWNALPVFKKQSVVTVCTVV